MKILNNYNPEDMSNSNFKKVWRAPMVLGVLTLFGLLSALLGTGYWYELSWAAMVIPLGVIIYFFYKSKPAANS